MVARNECWSYKLPVLLVNLQASRALVNSPCPTAKIIQALQLEAQSNSQGNPLVGQRMKCYILNMSREIISATSVNATESL